MNICLFVPLKYLFIYTKNLMLSQEPETRPHQIHKEWGVMIVKRGIKFLFTFFFWDTWVQTAPQQIQRVIPNMLQAPIDRSVIQDYFSAQSAQTSNSNMASQSNNDNLHLD